MTLPRVGVIMGSDSDLETMRAAGEVLEELGEDYELRVVSAHRTPDDMPEDGRNAKHRGLQVIIAGAGGAAHLPGMIAAYTTLPVIGVPVQTRALSGVDSLYSIVQMPAGVPVATVAIGNARNAGLLALQILAVADAPLGLKLEQLRERQTQASRDKNKTLPKAGTLRAGGKAGGKAAAKATTKASTAGTGPAPKPPAKLTPKKPPQRH